MPARSSLHKVWGCLAIAFALGAGCSDETGIIIEVSRDTTTTPATIDRLRFFLGVRQPGQGFLQDREPLQSIELAAGRDLAGEPYQLLLHDGTPSAGAELLVGVVGYQQGQEVGFGALDTAVAFESNKLVKWSVVLVGEQRFEVSDTGCISWEGGEISAFHDKDCDGDLVGDPPFGDCGDNDPDVGPSQQEVCSNGVDDNCNGVKDEDSDDDEDGVTRCNGDCRDDDDEVAPGYVELCDGKDNNCDGSCDEEFDVDGDRYTTCGSKIKPGGAKCEALSDELIDCRDNDELSHPGAEEFCDGYDNDCDQHCDEDLDWDEDGFTECGSVVDACNGTSLDDRDCKPMDDEVYPGSEEWCDGKDNNCDGVLYPEVNSCYGEVPDGDPWCTLGARMCDDTPGGEGWLDECQVPMTPGDEVSMDLCEAYESCVSDEVADPFVCAGGASGRY